MEKYCVPILLVVSQLTDDVFKELYILAHSLSRLGAHKCVQALYFVPLLYAFNNGKGTILSIGFVSLKSGRLFV